MKTSLLIMAAGIGSRYGVGIKQLEGVGPNGELIIDYSVHDAIAAGFNKIIFVIRRDIESDFRDAIGARIEAVCARCGVEVVYAFQDMKDIPEGFKVPEGRVKPWGTGQAVLAARDVIDEPFAVINADDYYGKDGFHTLHAYLTGDRPADEACLVGFVLKNTLSENGGVTRGICAVDENGMLTDIKETKNIVKTAVGVAAGDVSIDPESSVSMNMWGFDKAFTGRLQAGFEDFLAKDAAADPLKAEFLIPIFVGDLLKRGTLNVRVLESRDSWFGVTYKEDHDYVVESFRKLTDAGIYSGIDLFSDLQ